MGLPALLGFEREEVSHISVLIILLIIAYHLCAGPGVSGKQADVLRMTDNQQQRGFHAYQVRTDEQGLL